MFATTARVAVCGKMKSRSPYSRNAHAVTAQKVHTGSLGGDTSAQGHISKAVDLPALLQSCQAESLPVEIRALTYGYVHDEKSILWYGNVDVCKIH